MGTYFVNTSFYFDLNYLYSIADNLLNFKGRRKVKMTSEKFCLKWNDFETNVSVAFRELRGERDFFDVTIACEDDQIQAHKVILSACSPFFKNLLRRNPHQHPLLYLKGISFKDIQSVFIHFGSSKNPILNISNMHIKSR